MKKYPCVRTALVCLSFLAACSDDGEGGDTEPPPDTPADLSARGPLDVAVATTSLVDDSRDRTLAVEVWYPTEAPGEASPVIDFAVDVDQMNVLAPLLDDAPAACVASTTDATRDASSLAGEYPVVLYSHCYTCDARRSITACADHRAHV